VCAAVLAFAQTASKSFVGTIAGFRPDTAEVEIKPDNAPVVVAKFTPETIAQRVAPGEKDLKKAETIKVTDVAVGDRVLATLEAGTVNLRRIVDMSLADIAKRNEADRLDWTRRGISGVVAAKNGAEVTLKMRTLTGEVQAVVTVGEKTAFKRYAPDSVKFADAQDSKLADVSVGDQLRARGKKSEDGLKVTADDVVFGTFLTRAGSITAVNAEAGEVTVKDMASGKPLVVKVTADSQLKKMPDMSAMMGMGGGMMGRGGGAPGNGPGGGPPAGAGAAAGTGPGMMGRGGAPGGGPGMMGRGGTMDISQMLERMPAAKLDDLKPGQTIVVSSTKGVKNDQITAIMLLANADMLIQMATMSSGRGGRAGGGGGMSGGGMGGMMGGGMGDMSGFGMPSIIF
jgi:co-chaperonin GroES (HSP10)